MAGPTLRPGVRLHKGRQPTKLRPCAGQAPFRKGKLVPLGLLSLRDKDHFGMEVAAVPSSPV